MESNRDWKAPVALVLAGLALFVALSGRADSTSVAAWPRFLEREAAPFVVPAEPVQPLEPLSPLEPTVPAPDLKPAPMPEMPPFKGEMFDKWRGREFQPAPELKAPYPPNAELRIRGEEHPYSWQGLREHMFGIFNMWFSPLTQLVQPLAILLLAWIIIRQARRQPSAAPSAANGTRDDITTPEGPQNGQ
jgi:hypothetical protein